MSVIYKIFSYLGVYQVSIKSDMIDMETHATSWNLDSFHKIRTIVSACMSEEMPCGYYVRRSRSDCYIKRYPNPISAIAIEWLSYVEDTEQLAIQHARNSKEFKIGRIPVDGFCR